MTVQANILDTILNTPTQASNVGSPKLGDAFLDSSYRGSSKGTGAWAQKTASVMETDGPLADAFTQVRSEAAKTSAHARSERFRNLAEAVAFADAFRPRAGVALPPKKAALVRSVKEAGARLARVLAKTPEQRAIDGASKIADYFNPSVVPGWAKQATSDLRLLEQVRQATLPSAKRAAAADVVEEKSMSDADAIGYVNRLLNEGVSPNEITGKIAKLAELQGFSKSVAQGYLNDHAGLLGMAYMEPNHYMLDCAKTARHLEKVGGHKAASVKQITACENGCRFFNKHAGHKTCGIHLVPIVANGSELLPIINQLTGGAKNKRAALVARANGDHQKIAQAPTAPTQFARTQAKGRMLTPADAKVVERKTAHAFTANTVLGLHNGGQNLRQIFAQGTKVAGVRQAKKAVKDFVKGLRDGKTKIALSQIDCTFLASKLGASNAIYGEGKCGSCTYRSGMHCGLTGGTLVTYPGMADGHRSRVASSAPDGFALAKEFDLTRSSQPDDIDMKRTGQDAVEMGTSRMDL